MKRNLFVGFIGAAMLLSGVAAYAHHSFAATYDESPAKRVTIEGKLLTFTFRNPHSFVDVQAPDKDGVMQRWIVEWGGAGTLGGQGITRDSLKAGDVIVVTGSPGRDVTEHRLRMVNLRRPSDGFSYGMKEGEKFD